MKITHAYLAAYDFLQEAIQRELEGDHDAADYFLDLAIDCEGQHLYINAK